MDGQLDMFDLIDDKPPVPPFTVWTSSRASIACGWCGSKNITGEGSGGGGGRGKSDDSLWLCWNYCGPCVAKYGHPRPHQAGYPILVDHIGPLDKLTKGTP